MLLRRVIHFVSNIYKEKEYIEFLKMMRIELKLTKHYGNTAFIIKSQIGQLSEVLQRCNKFYNVRQKKRESRSND